MNYHRPKIKKETLDSIINQELCTWKVVMQDMKSTTRLEVVNNPKHNLYRCLECDGYVHYSCKGYHPNGVGK